MFHRHGKKTTLPHTKPLKDLTAIVPPMEFLAENKRQELLRQMAENSALDSSRFDSLCLNLINNLVNYCQHIPETTNSYYALPGGLVDHALNRTEAALSLFRQYVVQDENTALSEEQKLWLYALFSAGILQGIGKLQIDYRVDLFDMNGQLLKQWHPLLESMTSCGSYYQFEFESEGEQDLRCRLNILLARQLMPASGFAWIISNPHVLTIWLALLSEDGGSAGTLGAILIRADAIAIQRYFNDFMFKGMGGRSSRPNRIGTFAETIPGSIIDKERMLGIEFIKWMTNQLALGEIIINKAPLFVVPGGLIMSVEIFKWFVREHPEFKNWQAAQVQNAFLALGLHTKDGDGRDISRFEQATTQQMHSGVVVAAKNAIFLPEQVQLHHLHTGEISSVSATELAHITETNHHDFNRAPPQHSLEQLSVSGEWQPAVEKPPTMDLRNTRGG